MGMYRIVCTKCRWTTSVCRNVLDCVRQAEDDWYITHISTKGLSDPRAHDDAFLLCPICGHTYKVVHRFYPQEQIDDIEVDRRNKLQAIRDKLKADPAFQEAQRQAYYAQTASALVYEYFPYKRGGQVNG